jgi:hypothetical protein
MPVPNLSGGSYTEFVGDTTTYPSNATTYDLTGFTPGWEICCAKGYFEWKNNTGSPITFSTTITIEWLDTNGTTVLVGPFSFSWGTTVPVGYWAAFTAYTNIGLKGTDADSSPQPEVDSNGTYYVKITDSYSGTSTTQAVVMSNVPSTTVLSGDKSGYMWVEGNDLCYIGKYKWKRSVAGVSVGATGQTPGFFWIDDGLSTGTPNALHWIGADGKDYTNAWQIQQFASWFGNGPTNSVSGKTPGGMWVDAEYGQTHIAYIGYNGYKFITGDGVYPYT